MTRKHSNTIQQTEKELADLENGFRHFFPKNAALVIAGVSFTPTGLAKTFEEQQKPYEEARAAHALLAEKTRSRDEKHEAVAALVKNAKKFLVGYFGESSQKLLDFGMQPKRKPAELTAKQKADKAEKARLTRAKNRGQT